MSTIRITFIDTDGTRHEFDDAPVGTTLMEIGKGKGVPGLLGDCGGTCACATCHVHVEPEWTAVVGAPLEMEEAMLDLEEAVRDNSRLSCQFALTEAMDGLVVRVPPR